MNLEKRYQSLVVETGRVYNKILSRNSCISKGMLSDYLNGDLDDALSQKISNHIAACELCQLEKMKVEADQTEFEKAMDLDPDHELSVVLGPNGAIRIAAIIENQRRLRVQKGISKIKASLIEWASPLWEPLLAGQPVTAADLTEQSRQFEMDYGEYISISCFWQGHDRKSTPHIRLTWRANLISPGNLWVRFANPDTRIIYSEFPLGQQLEGEARFDQIELGFDPAVEKWAVSVVVEKIEP
ncbi:hypothetical protein DSCO28_54260 [Desulfosarcina ovata subsp. sediminis]|uniref:Zinc-finger domain-containing protein n=1 Tax=Desulfosarcina ovata subsp. sediminis TaxID=885957 RepID=A0A5K7ZXM0_9BACT|nr:zf-HC2 domain-containing protein [Desulfosarcina ovata]BBO84860.1 hypothetical protein DSCO28_54260 [Desulfosarcina ovata subsp. sediminis]